VRLLLILTFLFVVNCSVNKSKEDRKSLNLMRILYKIQGGN
jgi:hypothetical protein